MSAKTRITRRQFIVSGAMAAALAACAKQTPAPTEAPAAATEAPAPEATEAPAPTEAEAEPEVEPSPEMEETQDVSNTNLEQIERLADEMVTVTAFASPVYTATDVVSFSQQLFDQKMEELTNVHVEWEHAAEYGDQLFELKMASGDLPDIMLGVNSVTTFAKYGQLGAFEPLNDYIASNQYLSTLLREKPEIKAMITAPDGNIYAFPRLLEIGQQAFGGFFMRQDWLDEVDLPMPQTTDEYYEALVAMKAQDPTRYPLAGYMQSLNFLLWQWGVGSRGPNQPLDFYHDGDEVKYGPIQPQFKEALAFINKLFQEELIDPEYTTLVDPTAAYKRWTDGVVGVGYGWADDFVAITKVSPDIVLVAHKPPAGPYGHREVLSNHMDIDASNGAGITITSEHKELIARYFDLYYSRSGALLMNFGIFGDTYTEEDGEPVYADKVLNDEKLGPLEYVWNYVSPTWIGPMLMMTAQERGLYTGAVGEAQVLWDEAPWQTIQMPPLMFTEDETSIIQQVMTDINTLVDENIAGFIEGTKSLDVDYEAMVSTIIGLGIDDVRVVYQDAYDRFLAALA